MYRISYICKVLTFRIASRQIFVTGFKVLHMLLLFSLQRKYPTVISMEHMHYKQMHVVV